MLGNFDVDVQHQQRIGHLFGPLPPEMKDDTAFMDRIHAYLPGWDIPKVQNEILTDHFGLVSDFCPNVGTNLGSSLEFPSFRDEYNSAARSAVGIHGCAKTSAAMKLMYPNPRHRCRGSS